MNRSVSVKFKLEKMYNFLIIEYGHQGWWPVTHKGEHIPKYNVVNHSYKNKLEIIIGSILTQNTQWKPNVENAIIELNKKDLIDIDKILKIKNEDLAKSIKSSGYYNEKAKKLKNIASFLKDHPLRSLEKLDMWKARELLLRVNGVGPETVDSILLYALNKPIFVVDAYTRRILLNLGMIKSGATYDEIQKLFMDNLENDNRIFNEYHALLVEHAKRYYRKKENYKKCPLLKIF